MPNNNGLTTRNASVVVDEIIGSSYPVVKYVAQYINDIRHVSANLQGVVTVGNNIATIITVSTNIQYIIDLGEHIDGIILISDNIDELLDIYANMDDIIASGAAAEASALLAQQWAANPYNDDVEPGLYSALHYATVSAAQADISTDAASDAATSAGAALISENAAEAAQANAEDALADTITARNAAQLAKTNAETAQTAAELAETNAETAAATATTQAGIATGAASTATTQAGIATGAASAASTSAANALTAENNAETAETNAETAQGLSEDARDLAEQYANADEDVEIFPGVFSAKHWAIKAEEIVGGGGVASVNGETGTVVITSDDIDDTGETNKWATQAQLDIIDFITLTEAIDLDNLADFINTPSSANLRALLTDETGTGAAVFASSPALDGAIVIDNTSGTPLTLQVNRANQFSAGLNVSKRGQTGDITASVLNNAEIGYHGFLAWDGSAYQRGAYVIVRAAEDISSGAYGMFYSIVTVTPGTTTAVARLIIGTGVQIGAAPTGGDQGAGTINAAGSIYKNGVAYPELSTANTWSAQQIIGLTSSGGIPLIVRLTQDDAVAGPILNLDRLSASPLAADGLGVLRFGGRTSTGAGVVYGDIGALIVDPTNGNEDSSLFFKTQIAGALTTIFTITQGMLIGAPTGGDKGAGTINSAGSIYKNNVAYPEVGVANTWTAQQTMTVAGTFGVPLILIATDDDANPGPFLILNRVPSSGAGTVAANDEIGTLRFQGLDSAGNAQAYADVGAAIIDPASTSEDAQLLFKTIIAGAFTTRARIGHGLIIGSPTSGDKGAGSINAEAGYINNNAILSLADKASNANVWAAVSNKVLTADLLEAAAADVTIADGGAMTLDWDSGINFVSTITANRTLQNPTNGQPGTYRTWRIAGNDGTDRVITYGAQFLGDLPTVTDLDSGRQYLFTIRCITTTVFNISANRVT